MKIWSLIFYFSLIGGLFLILSRYLGDSLYYLSGYLFLFSYLIVIIFSILIANKKGINGLDCFKMCLGIFVGMTLIYIVFVLMNNLRLK